MPVSFIVEWAWVSEFHPEETANQFTVTDDGALIVNNTHFDNTVVVFQLDPVLREGQCIKTIQVGSFPFVGLAYSNDPAQKLVLFSNGHGMLTLFDGVELEFVGSFACDTHHQLNPFGCEKCLHRRGPDNPCCYLHRERMLQDPTWREEAHKSRMQTFNKIAAHGDLTLNLLRLNHDDYAHVLFDRNRLILYGTNHYYMKTYTLGPPASKMN